MTTTLRINPTLDDIATAAKFMASHNGSAKAAESLWGLLACTRAQERERCAKQLEVLGRRSDSNTDASYARRGAEILRAMANESEEPT